MLKGFKEFIMRGNVVDLAVGLVVGSAFTNIVNSLVKDIITPFIGAIIKAPDFSGLNFTINSSKFMYGTFINNIISFLIVSASIYFFIVSPINKVKAKIAKEEPKKDDMKVCPQCISKIPKEAKKCMYCTSVLE